MLQEGEEGGGEGEEDASVDRHTRAVLPTTMVTTTLMLPVI